MIFFFILTFTLYFSAYLPGKLRKLWFYKLAKHCCTLVTHILNIEIIVQNKKNLQQEYPVIFISNHPSELDLFLFLPLIKNVNSLFAKGILDLPIIGKIVSAASSVFIDVNNASSRQQGLRKLMKTPAKQHPIILFPEGTCSPFNITYFKPGAFFISKKNKVPIVPIYVNYINKSIYANRKNVGYFRFFLNIWNGKNKMIKIYCFDPVFPDNFSSVKNYREDVYQKYLLWEKIFNE